MQENRTRPRATKLCATKLESNNVGWPVKEDNKGKLIKKNENVGKLVCYHTYQIKVLRL